MAGQLHRDGARDAGAFQIAHGRPAEAMGHPARGAGRDAGRRPRLPEIADRGALPMEDPGDDGLRAVGEGVGPLPLLPEEVLQGWDRPERGQPLLGQGGP